MSSIKVIECPRDAMQGIKTWINSNDKIDYIQSILSVGFDVIHFGSFVSSRAVPQMKDSGYVLDHLDLSSTKSKLLSIVANIRGAKQACCYPQIDYLGSYNPRLNTIKNGLIDWSFSSRDLYNFINAFDDPYPGASTFLDRGNFGKLHLKKVHLHAGDGSNHPYMSGIVSRHDKDWIVVSTSDKYMLLIESIINQKGENIISKIKPGDRFHTPVEILSAAKSLRVSYTSKG